jgi:transcriptional regulator with XRE-family HTH domain
MRKRKGLTQTGLAKRTGRTQSHISAIEKGVYDPRASTLLAIATALGCELILVPKERAGEARGMAGLSGRAVPPSTLLEEVYVPEPEGGGDDAG